MYDGMELLRTIRNDIVIHNNTSENQRHKVHYYITQYGDDQIGGQDLVIVVLLISSLSTARQSGDKL